MPVLIGARDQRAAEIVSRLQVLYRAVRFLVSAGHGGLLKIALIFENLRLPQRIPRDRFGAASIPRGTLPCAPHRSRGIR